MKNVIKFSRKKTKVLWIFLLILLEREEGENLSETSDIFSENLI